MSSVPAATDDALITTFGRLVEAHSNLGRQLGRALEQECGVSHSTFEVLLRISRADEGLISMSTLAQQVALSTGGITRLLDRVIDQGYVTRVPCPTDRRVQFAALTDSGRRTLERAMRLHAGNLRTAFQDFSERDLQQFDRLLDKLRTSDIAADGRRT